MSEVATDTAAANATPAPDGNAPDTASSAQDTAPQGDAAPQSPQPDGNQPDFSLPDEYKDKPWAEKIKSADDAYKQIDNLTSLVGKKTIQPIDYETASPEEIAAHHAQTAPEDVSAYSFGEGADPDFSKAVGELLKENGISAYQGNKIIEKVQEITAGMAESKQAVDRSDDGYLELLKGSFGDNYKEVAPVVDEHIKKFATPEDYEFFDGISDNQTRAAVDRVIHNILQKYGAFESGAQTEGNTGQNQGVDVAKTRADLRKQIAEIDSRPHTFAEKKALIDQLQKTYD